jgi:hypothetical protein
MVDGFVMIMVEGNSLMAVIGMFIAVAIFLSLGLVILDSTVSDCSNLEGYNSANPSASTGWSGSCEDNNSQIQNAWTLTSIVLIVIASVIILAVVKML